MYYKKFKGMNNITMLVICKLLCIASTSEVIAYDCFRTRMSSSANCAELQQDTDRSTVVIRNNCEDLVRFQLDLAGCKDKEFEIPFGEEITVEVDSSCRIRSLRGCF